MVSEEEKARFLNEHFAFEVRELIYSVWFFITSKHHEVGVQLEVEQFLLNTSLDHFLLHARNLLEFYYWTGKPSKYANAKEYIPDWRTKISPAIRKLDKWVYPEVTHLA